MDAYGRYWATLIPDDAPDEAAPMGLPLGPVSLEDLKLPFEMEVRIHNELFRRRIFTYADVQRGGADRMAGVIRAVVKVGAQELIEHYRKHSAGGGPDPSA